jgi:hypothetical protein
VGYLKFPPNNSWPNELASCAGGFQPFRHHLSNSPLGASPRHRYGRAFISTPTPTIPSKINTSSPITIQPCSR